MVSLTGLKTTERINGDDCHLGILSRGHALRYDQASRSVQKLRVWQGPEARTQGDGDVVEGQGTTPLNWSWVLESVLDLQD